MNDPNPYKAYFVVVFDSKSRDILFSDVWSDAPWSQSRRLKNTHAGVFMESRGSSFHDARNHLLKCLAAQVKHDDNLWLLVKNLRDDTLRDFATIESAQHVTE